MSSNWMAYNELAWTEDWFVEPSDYEEEVGFYVSLIHQYADEHPTTLLHLGSGAGGMDHVFKRGFAVTGVDISPKMLDRARSAHPDIEYIEADIRSLRLNRLFDAVAIPDCIDYMTSLDDLRRALNSAAGHLRPGGVLLVVGKTSETFQNNNFVYTGEKNGLDITLFENNHIYKTKPDSYEATLVYLIRRHGELTTHIDRHELGLFSLEKWELVFSECNLELHQHTIDGVYDEYLLGNGAYPMQVFIGKKGRRKRNKTW